MLIDPKRHFVPVKTGIDPHGISFSKIYPEAVSDLFQLKEMTGNDARTQGGGCYSLRGRRYLSAPRWWRDSKSGDNKLSLQ